ncbi:hypothetical protein F2P81_011916 [Scophthalmus maximus]|uniref:Uncharacterized protein n=1 Tax=Scophthalmus maximus TaxID=52904 RepID=A0A6A4SZX4_SCOMX|nr:hypothetical protein F2P81_011916 [Scophthalmus maximus]
MVTGSWLANAAPNVLATFIFQDEPTWHVVLDLKHIVELVVAPVHSDESISYLERKIGEHCQRYQELFPNNCVLPKHHYLEHYDLLIRLFGPLETRRKA